jgi:serine/threonine protein kinase
LQQAPHQAQPAFNLPDYDIERKVGEGGMGAVYLARHKQQGSRCALKVMLPKVAFNEKAREQFLREVENTRALRHDNFVEYLDHGAIGPIFYFLMVFYEGGNIADLIARRGGDVPLNEAWPIMLQTLQGLAFAHAAGFVHRDLKPQNILLDGRENAWTAKVADLGVMKDFEKAGLSGMTVTGSVIGTYPFMPREQLVNFKYVKPVSDVWSVGATFYNMLTGQYPRETRRGQDPMMVVLRNHAVPIRQRMSSIPSRVAQILDRALATKTDARYQNAGEMLRALEAAL